MAGARLAPNIFPGSANAVVVIHRPLKHIGLFEFGMTMKGNNGSRFHLDQDRRLPLVGIFVKHLDPYFWELALPPCERSHFDVSGSIRRCFKTRLASDLFSAID